MAQEKIWNDCSKEEKEFVNRIRREFRKAKSQYETNEIKWWKYYSILKKLESDLDWCEWFYSDGYQEFVKYKENIDEINAIREKL